MTSINDLTDASTDDSTYLFMGEGAGNGQTAASNTGVGIDAMASLTLGTDNTALGIDALFALTSGAGNTAIGEAALKECTEAGYNTAVGFDCMSGIGDGANNTAVGAYSGAGAGNGNVAVGYIALGGSSGNYNLAVGYQALGGEDGDVSGSYNIGMGYNAGLDVTSGSSNIIIGYEAGAAGGTTLSTGSSNILIGNSTGVPSGSTSNYLNIGGVITGQMDTVDIVLADGFKATTQSSGDNSTNIATTAYVDAATGGGGTVTVPEGGTGDTSFTAYAPIFGGTTTTGALQSGTVGTAGQVLMSNGPGALPTFQAAPVAYGGATDGGSGSSNLVLTSSSNQAQGWTATTYGLSVQLPAANTLSNGQTYFIKNEGTYSFTVIDNAGNIRWILDAGESVHMWCMNNSSAAGVWYGGAQGGTVSDLFNINLNAPGIVTAAGATGCNGAAICPLTSTTCFMIYYDSTTTAGFHGVVLTLSGETFSIGTPVSLQTQAATQPASMSCVALSSTSALVSMSSGAANTYVQVVSISGTTVTANSSVSVVAAATVNHQLFFISSTSAYFAYSSGTTSSGVVISVSGTTPSAGTIVHGAAMGVSGVGNLYVTQLSTTAYFYAYAGSTGSGYLAAQIFTVSGTTVTANTGITNQSNSIIQQQIVAVAITPTLVLVMCSPTSPTYLNAFLFSVSGTTIALLHCVVDFVPVQSSTYGAAMALNVINPSSIVLTYTDQNANVADRWFINQLGIKLDPITGTITSEFSKIVAVSCNTPPLSYSTQFQGYPIVGPVSTLTGKYGIAAMLRSSGVNKPALIYMNTVI